MGYLSIDFFILVCIVLIVYYHIPHKYQWQILLIASLIFYTSLGIDFLPFLLFVSASTYFGAIIMKRMKQQKKWIFMLVIGSNASVWFVTKVLFQNAYFSRNIVFDVIVPIGISYYVLQAISYLVDVYKGKTSVEKSFFRYLLFLSYFPTVIQGPISRYEEIQKQLFKYKKFNIDSFLYHTTLILLGIIKKLVVADRIAIFANYCFTNFSHIKGITLYLGALAYTIQIYTDFSGCVDICRGISGLFGIELTHNFNSPYFAMSIKEFWNRWHISLGRWLKDYIYIPLGGNQKGTLRKYLNLIITFGISGIWHGAGTNFILWGIMQAVFQIMDECTEKIRKKIKKILMIEKESFSEKLYRTLITFHLTMLSWIVFRSSNIRTALIYIRNMFSSVNMGLLFGEDLSSLGINTAFFMVLAIHICILIYIDFQHKNSRNIIISIRNSHILIRFCIYMLIIYDILLFGVYGQGYNISGFLYGGF